MNGESAQQIGCMAAPVSPVTGFEREHMIHASHTIRHVTTKEASRVDDLLNSTIERLIPAALALNHGIRVTRIGPGEYTVETATDVACGYIVYEHLFDGA
jgi:hypothetical protein